MQEKDFVTYEYVTKTAKPQDRTKAIDLYESFGWEVTSVASTPAGGLTLSLRRDRKLPHRQELLRLERQAEELFAAIEKQDRAKTLGASVFGYLFGCGGALVLGGGMSLCMLLTGNIPAMIGGIVLGVAGIAMCAVTYPIYQKIAARKTKQLLPSIDENEERLANLLEQGNALLRADVI